MEDKEASQHSVKTTYTIAATNEQACPNNKVTTIMNMECDEELAFSDLVIDSTKVQLLTTCSNELFVKSRSFYKAADISAIWEWIQNNRWVIFVALMAIGLLTCFFGRKLFKVVLFVTAMSVVTAGGLFICYSSFLYKDDREWVAWTVLSVMIILGILAGVLMLKLMRFGIFLLALWGGFLLGQLLWTSFIVYTGAAWVQWVSVIGFALVCALLALKIEEHVLIIATSFTGAYCFCRGVGMVAPVWPNDFTIGELIKNKTVPEVEGIFYAYLAGIIILTIAGCVVQYKMKKQDDEADRHPYKRFQK